MKRKIWLSFCLYLGLALAAVACSGGGSTTAPQGGNADQTAAPPQNQGEATQNGGQSAGQQPANQQSADLPKTVTIATHATGGAYHAVGSGLAKLISDKTPMRAVVQPTAGPNAWMNDLDAGNIQFGLLQAMDAGWAYNSGPGFDTPAKNLRIVLAGNYVFNTGFAVREDSGMTSLRELAGKRVSSDYGGNFSLRALAEADLASVGLTWDDVKQVPVPENSAGLKLLQDGNVEATMAASPDTPNTLETHQAVKLKILPFGDLKPADIQNGIPPEMQAVLDKHVPGVTLGVAKAGTGILSEDTVMFTYPILMAASNHTSADAVYEVLKTIYENHKEVASVHPWLAQWDAGTMLSDTVPAPYHEGAIRYFKEIGIWTDEHQRLQDQLLAQ